MRTRTKIAGALAAVAAAGFLYTNLPNERTATAAREPDPIYCDIRIDYTNGRAPYMKLVDTNRDGEVEQALLYENSSPIKGFGLIANLVRPGAQRTVGMRIEDARNCGLDCMRDMTPGEQARIDSMYELCRTNPLEPRE